MIGNAPSFDKKKLEKVEEGYIIEYAEKYGNKLINIRSNPNKTKKEINYKEIMESKTQLEERIAMLGNKLKTKDAVKNGPFSFDAKVEGKRIHTEARNVRCSKDEALTRVEQKKQEKIKELILYFD